MISLDDDHREALSPCIILPEIFLKKNIDNSTVRQELIDLIWDAVLKSYHIGFYDGCITTHNKE